jgi:hypothetical protein
MWYLESVRFYRKADGIENYMFFQSTTRILVTCSYWLKCYVEFPDLPSNSYVRISEKPCVVKRMIFIQTEKWEKWV